MPLLPSEFEINRARISNNNAVTTSESQSLIYLQRKTPAQRWDITLRSVKMDLDAADVIWGFAAAREQDLGLWEIVIPRYSFDTAADKTTNATGAIGDTSISIAESEADVSIGKYFQFSGHSKVYIVTDTSANTISFAPSLYRPVANPETITFNNVTWSCKLKGRPLEFEAQGNEQSVEMELDLVEAL